MEGMAKGGQLKLDESVYGPEIYDDWGCEGVSVGVLQRNSHASASTSHKMYPTVVP